MANYTQRRMVPADALLFDASSNLAGLRAGTSGNQELYGLSKSQYEANQAAGTDWASRPSTAAFTTGTEILLAGVGTSGLSRWRSDGALWRPANPMDLWVDTTQSSPTSSTTEGLLKQYAVPAGLLTAVRYIVIKVLYTKSGTSETATFRARLGTAGSTADQAIMTNNSTLSSTNRAAAVEGSFFASSATQLRGLGRDAAFGVGGFNAGATTTTYPTNATISNMDSNALILSLTVQMSVGVETATIAHVVITVA